MARRRPTRYDRFGKPNPRGHFYKRRPPGGTRRTRLVKRPRVGRTPRGVNRAYDAVVNEIVYALEHRRTIRGDEIDETDENLFLTFLDVARPGNIGPGQRYNHLYEAVLRYLALPSGEVAA